MEQFQKTILDIYSAPGNAENWNQAIKSINCLCGGAASAYMLVDDDLNTQISAHYGYPEYMRAEYEGQNGQAKDIRFQYLHNLVPGKVFREFEYVTDRKAWDECEWNRYQLEKMGLYYCMTARVSTHGLWSDFISVNRLKSLGQNTDMERQNLQYLLPHLSKASELHRLVNGLERRFGAVLSVLDKLLIGMVILDAQSRIVVANQAARAIAEGSGSFYFRGGSIKLFDEGDDQKFRELVNQVSQTAKTGANTPGECMRVDKRDPTQSILFEIMPIRDDGFSDSDKVKGCTVFIMDPKQSQSVSAKGLAKIFALTQSEMEITQALVNGQCLDDISQTRNTKIDTVRGQVKSILGKTNTHSQLGLLRLAVKLDPPFDKENDSSTTDLSDLTPESQTRENKH